MAAEMNDYVVRKSFFLICQFEELNNNMKLKQKQKIPWFYLAWKIQLPISINEGIRTR